MTRNPLIALVRALTLTGRQSPPRLQHVENGVTLRRDAGDDPRVLDSVYRALAILEGSISQLTLDRYSHGLGRPRGAAAPMIQRILPAGQTLPGFLGEITQSLAQTGNAWLRVPRTGTPGPVRVLDPTRCSARIDAATGIKTITYDSLDATDIRQLQLTHVPGEPLGQGPIQAWADGLRGAIDAHQYAASWTRRGGRPTGILTTDQTLSADMAKEWKAAANKTMTPEGGVAVLGNGLTYKQCYLTPAELQLLDVRKVNVISVARIFGIPARLMLTSGDGDSKTYANMEQESILFVRHTLMPYMREIEAVLSDLLPDDVRFNVDGFLRPDTTTRYAAHKVAIEAGFLTVDEVRAIEGLNPLPEPEQPEEQKEAEDDDEGRSPGDEPEPDPQA